MDDEEEDPPTVKEPEELDPPLMVETPFVMVAPFERPFIEPEPVAMVYVSVWPFVADPYVIPLEPPLNVVADPLVIGMLMTFCTSAGRSSGATTAGATSKEVPVVEYDPEDWLLYDVEPPVEEMPLEP